MPECAWITLTLCVALSCGCAEDEPDPIDAAADAGRDAITRDGGTGDAAISDASTPDALTPDALTPDAEPIPCINPPPIGCLDDRDCAGRFCCVIDDGENCLPSACECVDGRYACSEDCGSGRCLEGDACER